MVTAAVLDEAAKLVAPFEGYRRHVYRDPVGVETIGYGETSPHIIRCYRHSGISEPAARALLRRRLKSFAQDVDDAVAAPLTVKQHAALASFAYNVGLGAFRSSTLRRELNRRHYAAAANQLLRWDRAGGRRLAGLTRRRRAERKLFLRGSRPGTRARALATRARFW